VTRTCGLQSVKKLAASIEKLKAELSTNASSRQSATAVAVSKVTAGSVGSEAIVRPTKLVRNVSQPATVAATAGEVSATVTSSAADSTKTDSKPAEASSSAPLDQVDFPLSWRVYCSAVWLIGSLLSHAHRFAFCLSILFLNCVIRLDLLSFPDCMS